jgi:hypothetical protein
MDLALSAFEVKVSPCHDCAMLSFQIIITHGLLSLSTTGKSPLEDEGAWRILFQYLTTEMTYPQMEEEFISYLGDRYCADDWKDARDALFSADDLNDDATPLMNLQALYAKHVPQASSLSNAGGQQEDSPVVSASRARGRLSDTRKSRRSRQQPRVCKIYSFGECILKV